MHAERDFRLGDTARFRPSCVAVAASAAAATIVNIPFMVASSLNDLRLRALCVRLLQLISVRVHALDQLRWYFSFTKLRFSFMVGVSSSSSAVSCWSIRRNFLMVSTRANFLFDLLDFRPDQVAAPLGAAQASRSR